MKNIAQSILGTTIEVSIYVGNVILTTKEIFGFIGDIAANANYLADRLAKKTLSIEVLKSGFNGKKNEYVPSNEDDKYTFSKTGKGTTCTYNTFDEVETGKYLIGSFDATSKHKHQVIVDIASAKKSGLLIVPTNMVGYIIGRKGETIRKLSTIAKRRLDIVKAGDILELIETELLK